jgi:DNA-binding CsgD family transcriptional regulator
VTTMTPSAIVGRDEELGMIRAFVAAVERGPAALVLAGEAGIGKTILWEAGVDAAVRRFDRVLICRGVEAEASLSFAGLSELLAPVLAETMPRLPAPRRRALEVALLLVEPGTEVPDAHAIGLAVLDVFNVLAAQGPLVVAVDDLQWIDVASAGVLQLALRRLRDTPVGLLATVRESSDVAVPINFERGFAEGWLQRRSVGPLGVASLYQLLSVQLGLKPSRPELLRVQEATAGNPLFALELGRELVRLGTRVHPGEPLPVPSSLGQLLGVRLARLSVETRQVLLIAALAGRPTVEVVAAAHGHGGRTIEAVDEAVRAGVVRLADGRVRFTHPLFASVLHEQASPSQRRGLHEALAGVVTDVEARARHRARATVGPDASVAAELAAAAEHAAARGATAAGAELCELAAELTLADPALARQRLLRAARFHRLAGDGERATTLLTLLLAHVPSADERGFVYELAASRFHRLAADGERASALVTLLSTHVPSGVERSDFFFELAMTVRFDARLVEKALAEAGDDDARAARILAFGAGLRLFESDVRAALVDGRRALEKAERVGDPVLIAAAISQIGFAEGYAGEVTPGLVERGAEIEERLGLVLEFFASPRFALARLLMRFGELERARAILDELATKAEARGDEGTRVMVLWALGMLEWLAGRWSMALDHATEAHQLTHQMQYAHGRFWVGRVKATLEADLGLVEQARASAEESLGFSEAASFEFYTVLALGALGRVELARGNLEAAGRYLRDLPGRLRARGIFDPTLPVWADTIETLIALGEREQASADVEQYEVQAHRLGSPWGLAAAARCRGLLTAAAGDLAAAEACVERALAELEGTPYPFERARALLALGSVRRRAQKKGPARAALEQALAIFDELAAGLWADKARSELRRVSGRRASAVQLTDTERHVAALAAEGRTNKEIAAALYMGVSTVEAHLSRVYRKLGVRRAELAARLVTSQES